MPAMIRDSGRMWKRGRQAAGHQGGDPGPLLTPASYQVVIDDCKANGRLNPATMGSVPNVGLMAQKAEEYGLARQDVPVATDGIVRVVAASGTVLLEHAVKTGDIWRMCQTKDAPVRDWVNARGVARRLSDTPGVFWLDAARAAPTRS